MRYVDSRGRRQILTRTQAVYLDTAGRQFDRGWGGLASTLTVRLLRDRGLIVLSDVLYADRGWRVMGRTRLGDEVLNRWKNDAVE